MRCVATLCSVLCNEISKAKKGTPMAKKKRTSDKQRLVLMARVDQLERLAAITAKTGALQSELVRRAIDFYLTQEEAK